MTKRIETENGHFEEFEVIDLKIKVGDTIWFDENVGLSTPCYNEATVTDIHPDHWWIYDDGSKALGCVDCVVETGYGPVYYSVDFCDVITEDPNLKEEQNEAQNEITYEEALVSLVCYLDTPIARRKQSDEVNTCIGIIRKHLEESGVCEKCINKPNMNWL